MVLPKWGRLGTCPLPDRMWRDYVSQGGYYIPGAQAPFSRDGGYENDAASWIEKSSVVGFLFAHLAPHAPHAPHAEPDDEDVGRLLDVYDPDNFYISEPSFGLFWLEYGAMFRNTCTTDDAVHTFDVAQELAPGPKAPAGGI